jgi:hypothetical protein
VLHSKCLNISKILYVLELVHTRYHTPALPVACCVSPLENLKPTFIESSSTTVLVGGVAGYGG